MRADCDLSLRDVGVLSMAVTRERLRELDELERMLQAPSAPEPVRGRPAPPPQERGPQRVQRGWDAPVSHGWAAFGVLAWVVLLGLAMAVEPRPAEPDAPALLELASAGVVLAVLAAGLGFGTRRRWGFAASLVAALGLLVLSLACPVTGHHELAGWWFVQLGCVSGLVATSLAGLRRA
ncbi:MAG TPA: hypothetical protein VG452_02195 [Egibacteraceae bacterium]|nr:hypothetical protein [Actinomycetota bacterium]HWB71001.1 hypothetical protein [Egibacteraceae bacterium]